MSQTLLMVAPVITRLYLVRGMMVVCTLLSPCLLRAQYPAPGIAEDMWYKNSIIYTLDVDAFQDSDGDGTGDFGGLIKKLDYLDALGVDALWLSPFQPTPNQDDGYDITDYYGVDPRCGTPGDFAEFMLQAEKRGMRVIMDLVLNHTSDQHEWFQQARKNKNSKYYNWYVWSQKRPADADKGMVFPGVQKETWTRDPHAGEYYLHRFYEFQPDLNFDNPEVMAESEKIIGYWLNQGVSGFRLDAVPFIIEKPETGMTNPKHEFVRISEMRSFVQWRKGDAIILGEANVEPGESVDYFGEKGEGMHMMFNFYVNQHLFYALASADLKPLVKALQETKDIPHPAQWANFLRNHDEVDLGRLSEKQRNKVYARFGPEPEVQLYDRGIRKRMASMLNDPRQLRMAYSLLFSLPGTPVIRYGEEIGMGDDLTLKERLSVRTPMQWSDAKHAGFSDGDSVFRPVIDEGPYSYKQINVAKQWRDPESLLNHTARLIRLRKECPEIGLGDWKIVDTEAKDVLVMQYSYQGKSLMMMHNFSDGSKTLSLQAGEGQHRLLDLLADEERVVMDGRFTITLEGYGFKWYRINTF